ncbi:hypothetical protein [Thermosyntropha sp.]|uniref:hypothetical protein n=1 Tax=Thermosyntropha sp. TaxID=2740820 RepID=UPI0025E21024|nr:hypothetical protein [Thermosyntropha sp.]MBO8157940.1 hypothetical protein [Thermosyntropha sp.]
MQLKPGQRSILAYFADDNSARMAVEKLKAEGYTDVQLDSISRFPGSSPGRGSSTSISSMVIGNTDYDRSLGALLAADPTVSGISADFDLPGGYSYMVTVVTENEKANSAVNILKEYGASV